MRYEANPEIREIFNPAVWKPIQDEVTMPDGRKYPGSINEKGETFKFFGVKPDGTVLYVKPANPTMPWDFMPK